MGKGFWFQKWVGFRRLGRTVDTDGGETVATFTQAPGDDTGMLPGRKQGSDAQVMKSLGMKNGRFRDGHFSWRLHEFPWSVKCQESGHALARLWISDHCSAQQLTNGLWQEVVTRESRMGWYRWSLGFGEKVEMSWSFMTVKSSNLHPHNPNSFQKHFR